MADDDQLRTLTRSIVQAAEGAVDVEKDLVQVRRLISESPTLLPTHHRRRRSILAIAAGALLVVGAGVLALSRRSEPRQIATAPDSTLTQASTATTSPAANPTSSTDGAGWRATVDPSVAVAGATITITPTGPIERICTDIVTIWHPSAAGLVLEGQILTTGEWVPVTPATPPTWPACIGDTTAEPLTVSLPADIPTGQYVICITSQEDPVGCGVLTVTNPDAPAGSNPPSTSSSTSFAFEPADDGRVSIGYDIRLQSADLSADAIVPFSGSISEWGHADLDQLWVADTDTGELVVFDDHGSVSSATRLPTAIGDGRLRSVAVGPAGVVYGLFVQITDTGEDVTVAAYEIADSGEPIRTWSVQDTSCVEYCSLRPTADGLAWEGNVVPYVDSTGQEVVDPAVLTPARFGTTWGSSDGAAIPDTVDARGPIAPDTEPAWSLTIEQIRFDNDLGDGFQRQADGSLTARVQLEPVRNARERSHDVLIRLVDGRGVAAIDRDTVPGLAGVAVRSDGTLIGIAPTDGGISVGPLVPRNTLACDAAVIERDFGTGAALVDDRCDGTWALVDAAPDDPSDDLLIGHRIDDRWALAHTSPSGDLCARDLIDNGAPALVVDAVEWACWTFDAGSIQYRPEPGVGDLTTGYKGPRVQRLQAALISEGLLPAGSDDGSFGPATRGAVISQQLLAGLSANGTADVSMIRTLRADDVVPAVLTTYYSTLDGLTTGGFAAAPAWIRDATRQVSAQSTVRDGVFACRITSGDFWLTEVGGLYIVWEGESLETAFTGNWGYAGSAEPPLIVDPEGITVSSTRAELFAAYGDLIVDFGDELWANQLRFRFDSSGRVVWLGAIDCGD